jgi:tetratricopeptide (TPR) repeat protein
LLVAPAPKAPEMGLGAGGRIRQEIVEDYYGADTWDEELRGKIYVRIVNSVMFKQITGLDAPPSPISAKQYTDAGLPWFDYYDEAMPAVLPSAKLAGIRPVGVLDKAKGVFDKSENEPVHITPEQLRRISVPSKQERLALLSKNALACFDAKKFDMAKRHADLILEMESKDALALRIRAECNLVFRKWEHAEQDASDCLELDPDSAFTLRTRAKANLMLRDYEQAVKDATASLEKHPDNIFALNIRAEAHWRLDLYKEAIADASAVIKLDSKHDEALRIRAESHRMLGNNTEAIADATASLNIHPTSVFALNTRAESFRKLGNYFDSRLDAAEALKLDSNNAFTKALLSKLAHPRQPVRYKERMDSVVSLIDAKKYEKALSLSLELCENATEEWQPFHCAALSLFYLGRHVEAKAILLKCPPLHHDTYLIQHNWACIEVALGNLVKAREHAARVICLNPSMKKTLLSDPDLALIAKFIKSL